MNKRTSILLMISFTFISLGTALGQPEGYYLLDSYSVNFWEDEDWGRYQNRRYEGLNPPHEGRIHLNEPPGWATFNAVWTERDGYNKIKCGWQEEMFPGWGTNFDWYIEYIIDIDPFSIGQGCMTEFHLRWPDDPDAHPDVQAMPNWFSADFCLGHFHKALSGMDSSLVWLCGSDVPGNKYALYAPGYGWTGIPIIIRLWKKERTLYFLVKKEEDADFTELYSMPCAIGASPGYVGWSLSCTGEWGCIESRGQPWSGKVKYFRIYSNAPKPQYSVNFAETDDLGPFMIMPGSESTEMYSFSENPGYLRIHTEYAPQGIMTAKNILLQPFSPNLHFDFYVITGLKMDLAEIGQGFGIKITLVEGTEIREVVCYCGKSSEELVGIPGGLFFAAGLKGEEVITDAMFGEELFYVRMARIGTELVVDYSLGSSTKGYRRLAIIPNMGGGLVNVMLAAANYGDWGALESTTSMPVDIQSIFIEGKTVDVTPYYTRDNDFNNGLEPFSIPSGQEDAAHYSLTDRPGWLRIESQFYDDDLDGAKNALAQIFDEAVTSGISVVTRIDLNPEEEGQIFGMQLERISGSGTQNAVLRFGTTSPTVTGGNFQKFFEYGYEGETKFIDASAIGTPLLLRIERFGEQFIFSYSTGSEDDYIILGKVSSAGGSIFTVTIATANLMSYGATASTSTMRVDIDYFRFEQNSIADGQCEFLNGDMPWPWHLLNVDSTAFSLTERDGWLKVMTGFNDDAGGSPRKGPNAIRAEFPSPHPGIEGDFDFTTLMEGTFTEPGQVVEIKLDAGEDNFRIRYGMIGQAATSLTIQAGIEPDLNETSVPNIGVVFGLRIARYGSTLYFQYLDGLEGEWATVNQVETSDGIYPVRYATMAANNIAAYGAIESTVSVPVYIDYLRFNRIDDFLAPVVGHDVLPDDFVLFQNAPNPFNPETVIHYQIPKMIDVKVEVYNILGQKVRTLVDKKQLAGRYAVRWDGRNNSGVRVASGLYIYVLRANEFKLSKKMIFIQ